MEDFDFSKLLTQYSDKGRTGYNPVYYTSNQNVTKGIDESVVDHFYVIDMYSELYDIFG